MLKAPSSDRVRNSVFAEPPPGVSVSTATRSESGGVSIMSAVNRSRSKSLSDSFVGVGSGVSVGTGFAVGSGNVGWRRRRLRSVGACRNSDSRRDQLQSEPRQRRFRGVLHSPRRRRVCGGIRFGSAGTRDPKARRGKENQPECCPPTQNHYDNPTFRSTVRAKSGIML